MSSQFFSNLIWRFLERCGAQLVGFIVSIILARLLEPENYGILALVTVFISILQVFIDSGLGNALIQKKEADEIDYSTVFYFNIIVCFVLFVVLYISAPYIATFYRIPELATLVRVLSLSLIISGVKNIQQAYVSRNMLFKKFFWATLGGTVIAAIIGIWMAYNGYGVWALVAQYLSNATIDTLILWKTVKWRPKKVFSLSRLKSLFSYGWKLLASSLLEVLYKDIHQLIIGKMYSSADLAYYNKGNQIPNLIINNINTSIDSVLLPTMSRVQDNREAVKNMTRRAIKTSVFLMSPLMIGLACTSKQVVELLLTEKWLPCVPYLIIFCVIYLFYPIHTANLNAIKAMGRSDLFLKLEMVKKIMGTVVLVSTVWFGPLVICASGLVTTVFGMVINSWPNRKLLNYSIIDQWKDIAPSIGLSLIMGVAVWLIGYFSHFSVVLTLIIQIIIGAIIYISGAYLFKMDSFTFVMNIVKSYISKKK